MCKVCNNSYPNCPACSPDTQYVECPECDGYGYTENNDEGIIDRLTCTMCEGEGEIESNNYYV